MASTNASEPSPYVTFISADGFEFHVRRSAALRSGTIRRMLDQNSKFSSPAILDSQDSYRFADSLKRLETLYFLSFRPRLEQILCDMDLTCYIGGFSEAMTGVCRFETISGVVLEKVVEYFYYAEKYRDVQSVPDMPDLPPELCLELLMVADFLET